ncbi:MAG: AAA family ATPase [Myxococcales bacterium]|nr:AAA family ATPase [Myxococcales bacterium]
MSIPVITFFNNKGGVGKTSLVYHLAWMYSELGYRVLAADLDPQANLSAAFLDEEELLEFWPEGNHPKTIFGFLEPLIKGTGDIGDPFLKPINDKLAIIIGDLLLSTFEDQLSEVWPKCLDRDERAFRVTSALWRILQKGGEQFEADLILMDLGPNLGAINRTALISSDFVVVPLSPDLFSLQGLRNLGPTLRKWRSAWKERLERNPAMDIHLPSGLMKPIGYILLQHSVRLDRPVKAYERWIEQIPDTYHRELLEERESLITVSSADDHCLALLKHYRSLMPLAQEARKPMFALKSADGAIGSHLQAVQRAQEDFAKLARSIAERTGITQQTFQLL